mgnify:CR=1 FL=1
MPVAQVRAMHMRIGRQRLATWSYVQVLGGVRSMGSGGQRVARRVSTSGNPRDAIEGCYQQAARVWAASGQQSSGA